MTEKQKEYARRRREKIEANPELKEAQKRAERKYHHNRYATDENFRKDMLERARKRFERMRADGTYEEHRKRERERRRERYRNDDEFRERARMYSLNYYYRKKSNKAV